VADAARSATPSSRVKGLSRLENDAVQRHRTNRKVVVREVERMAEVLRRDGLRSTNAATPTLRAVGIVAGFVRSERELIELLGHRI
jgi:hypothetical protein